ncbi:MAG: ATP-binding protein [Granulosicoccus sp.]
MSNIHEFVLDALAEVGGGRGASANHYTPHLIAAILWAIFGVYEWVCKKTDKSTGDNLIIISFAFGFFCEVTLFSVEAIIVNGPVDSPTLHMFWPPLKHVIELLSWVVLAAAFIQLLTGAKRLSLRFLAVGLVTIIASLAAVITLREAAIPAQEYSLLSNTAGVWILHGAGVILSFVTIALLASSSRALKHLVIIAFSLLSLADILMLFKLISATDLGPILAPIVGNLHIWVIPLLGFAAQQFRRVSKEQMQHGIQIYERLESLGQLSSGIAHDFNNHLQIIQGYVEVARMSHHDEKATESSLSKIEEAAERAGSLVNQLLTFSRDKGTHFTRLDMNEIITSVTPMVSRLLGPDINLIHDLDMRTKPVLADQRMFEQIIVNLIVNSRDAMSEGGTITVKSRAISKKDEMIRISEPGTEQTQLLVTDTGSGMEKETIQRAFEPFFTTKPVGHGTGLGLSTVYGIVKKHKGHITIESVPGKFTTVCIELPISTTASADKAEQKQHRPIDGKETILLAEDEIAIRDLAHQLLSASGYNVLVANDGQHAINIVSTYKGQIDLCLFDVIMPRISGYQTYQGIVELDREIPVLFMTGSSSRAEVLKGDHYHLQKPFTRLSLLKAVRQQLDNTETKHPAH